MSRPFKSLRASFIESLEQRLLWAANLAPTAVNGFVLAFTITSGDGAFSDVTGPFQLHLSADAWSYTADGSLSGPGSFEYNPLGSNNAALDTYDIPAKGDFNIMSLAFSSPTAGSYQLISNMNVPEAEGHLFGSFQIVSNGIASLSNGTLSVNGTFIPNQVSITKTDDQLYVTRDGYTEGPFKAADVTNINISLGDGRDRLTVGKGVQGVYCNAGAGNDTLIGGEGPDTLTGGPGVDSIDGGAGDDRLNGYSSADHLIGNDGYDRLYGGEGDDLLEGGGGVDRIWGGNGNDVLVGGGSNDKLFGEAGIDTLYGGRGSDLLDGGADTDVGTSDGVDSVLNIP